MILSTHTNINTTKQQVRLYLQDIFNWFKQNNLILNPSKTQTMLFNSHPAEHSTKLRLTINNTTHPTEQKHNNTRSNNRPPRILSQNAYKTRQTKWRTPHKNTKSARYYALGEIQGNTTKHIHCHPQNHTRIWKHYLVTNYIRHKHKLQTVQNTALRITTECTRDTSTQHLHEETRILPIKQNLAVHASQLRQKA